MLKNKILIFDDEQDTLQVVQKRLKEHGYIVVAIQSSNNAIADIKREQPDLILLDIAMPDKDGYQVCEEIRCDATLKHLPVIVFTAKPLEKTFMDKAYDFYGATDFLNKPFDDKELFKKIEKYLKIKK